MVREEGWSGMGRDDEILKQCKYLKNKKQNVKCCNEDNWTQNIVLLAHANPNLVCLWHPLNVGNV